MSGAIAGVDVVGSDYLAHELLREIVHFIGRLRAAEHAHGVRPLSRYGPPEPFGGAIERFGPAGLAQLSGLAIAYQGLSEALVHGREVTVTSTYRWTRWLRRASATKAGDPIHVRLVLPIFATLR